MKLLADTHVVIWTATDPERIGESARAAMQEGGNELFVSVITAWEIAIKQSLGKLDLPKPAEEWLPEVLRRTGFEVADLTLSAALRVRGLPWHHRDPFDRLLIAQAFENGHTLVTHDEVFAAYGVPVLMA